MSATKQHRTHRPRRRKMNNIIAISLWSYLRSSPLTFHFSYIWILCFRWTLARAMIYLQFNMIEPLHWKLSCTAHESKILNLLNIFCAAKHWNFCEIYERRQTFRSLQFFKSFFSCSSESLFYVVRMLRFPTDSTIGKLPLWTGIKTSDFMQRTAEFTRWQSRERKRRRKKILQDISNMLNNFKNECSFFLLAQNCMQSPSVKSFSNVT